MKNTLFIPAQSTPHITLPAQKITWKQDLSHLKRVFSEDDLSQFLSLYSKAQTSPRKVRKEVEQFLEKHPDTPEILNLLTFIYFSLRKIRGGNRLVKENYQKNPQSIFARINYADLCLRKNRPEKVPEIFDGKYSLPELYPNKKLFHISEFRGFMVSMSLYHLATNKKEAAEEYLYLVRQVAPHHPSIKVLEQKIYGKRLIVNILKKLLKKNNA